MLWLFHILLLLVQICFGSKVGKKGRFTHLAETHAGDKFLVHVSKEEKKSPRHNVEKVKTMEEILEQNGHYLDRLYPSTHLCQKGKSVNLVWQSWINRLLKFRSLKYVASAPYSIHVLISDWFEVEQTVRLWTRVPRGPRGHRGHRGHRFSTGYGEWGWYDREMAMRVRKNAPIANMRAYMHK